MAGRLNGFDGMLWLQCKSSIRHQNGYHTSHNNSLTPMHSPAPLIRLQEGERLCREADVSGCLCAKPSCTGTCTAHLNEV